MLAVGTILHHFFLFHIQWLITPALHPCMVFNTRQIEGEHAVLTDLGTWPTGLQGFAHFFSPGENSTLGSSFLCLKGAWKEFSKIFNTGLLLKSTPCNFRRSSRAKQELWNLMLNPFWDFPRKYWVIKQKFPLLSVLALTLSSLSSTDEDWEVGRDSKC